MSKQLKITAGIRYNPTISGLQGIDSGLREVFESSEADYTHGTMEVSDNEKQLVQSAAIESPGYVMLINTSQEHQVFVGLADISAPDDARPIALRPGSIALFHANGDIYCRAETDPVRVEYYIFEAK